MECVIESACLGTSLYLVYAKISGKKSLKQKMYNKVRFDKWTLSL